MVRYDQAYNNKIARTEANFNRKVARLQKAGLTNIPSKVSIKDIKNRDRAVAAIFETAGQAFYVYAMSGGNAIIAAPLIGSYCIVSLVLSRIILKEKLSKKKYISVALVLIGIVMMGIIEGLAE